MERRMGMKFSNKKKITTFVGLNDGGENENLQNKKQTWTRKSNCGT